MIAHPVVARVSSKQAVISSRAVSALLQANRLGSSCYHHLSIKPKSKTKRTTLPPSTSTRTQDVTTKTFFRAESTSSSSNTLATPTSQSTSQPLPLPLYQGPLASTFRRLKLFSLSSFALATALTPVLLFAPAELGMPARIGLAITALATSGSSFALIGWISKPYVTEMRLRNSYSSDGRAGIEQDGKKVVDNRLRKAVLEDPISSSSEEMKAVGKDNDKVLECLQLSSILVPLITTIYQPNFLTSTERPFCSWTLSNVPPIRSFTSSASASSAPSQDSVSGNASKDSYELLIAETRHAKSGELKGRYIAKWSNDTKRKDQEHGGWKSEGICYEIGKVQKFFNVHEELLGDEWKVVG